MMEQPQPSTLKESCLTTCAISNLRSTMSTSSCKGNTIWNAGMHIQASDMRYHLWSSDVHSAAAQA